MATIGEVNAKESQKEEASAKKNRPVKLYFGVFFDGTGNNMIQRAAAVRIKNSIKNQLKKNSEKAEKTSSEDADDKWERELVNPEENGRFDKGANRLLDEDNKESINKTKEEGYSNIAFLHSHYQGVQIESEDSEFDIRVFNIYVEGAGTAPLHIKNTFYKAKSSLGSLFGYGKTGVVYLVSKALEMLLYRAESVLTSYTGNARKESEIHIDVFGFSRGATCARMFAFCSAIGSIGKDKLPCFDDLAESYLSEKYVINSTTIDLFKDLKDVRSKISIDMLGIFDTVSSIGMTVNGYRDNVTTYGLYSPTLPAIGHTFHICAIDEFRSHFAITTVGNNVPGNAAELFLPGCHSDIGGGYIEEDEDYSVVYATTIDRISTTYPKMSPLAVGRGESNNSFGDQELYGKQYLIPKNSPTKNGDSTIPLRNYLRDYGWISESDTCTLRQSVIRNIRNHSVVIHRTFRASDKDKPRTGYGGIPLEIMMRRANEKTGRKAFNDIKGKPWEAPTAIITLFGGVDKINSLVSIANGARTVYYPGGSWSSPQYKALRKYLHFSAHDDIGFDMSSDSKKVIRRIMYHGDIGDEALGTSGEEFRYTDDLNL